MDTKTITLKKPLTIGTITFDKITLREPNALQLAKKNINIHALMMGNIAQLSEVLPLISEPILSKEHMAKMSAADINKCAQVVTAFLYDPNDQYASPEEEMTEPQEEMIAVPEPMTESV